MSIEPAAIDAIVRPDEIADRLKLSKADLPSSMLRLRRRGLHMFRIGRSYVTTDRDLQEFILDQRQQGGAR